LITCSFATIRFFAVLRQTIKKHCSGVSRVRVKPRNVKASGFPFLRCFRFRAAFLPNSINRVLSARNSKPNSLSAGSLTPQGRGATRDLSQSVVLLSPRSGRSQHPVQGFSKSSPARLRAKMESLLLSRRALSSLQHAGLSRRAPTKRARRSRMQAVSAIC
jgi:hypothetical protein